MLRPGSCQSLWLSPTSNNNNKSYQQRLGFFWAVESPKAGTSEDSLLIFGSVNVDRLRTRISKQEERPS